MSHLRIVPIVEGHGEWEAIRILLGRIGYELVGGRSLEVLQPIRRPRTKLVSHPDELLRAIDLAALKLRRHPLPDATDLILVLLDANGDAPCKLGPELQEHAARDRPHLDVACVMANIEYETWFVAAAESLTDFLDVHPDQVPTDPEASRSRKAWIEERFQGTKYSETVDQARMTAKMDLRLCRRRSASFDKLCRELEQRLR